MNEMQKMNLRFQDADQVISFVNVINDYPYNADIKYGSCVVDAKSLMGVLSLALAKTVQLVIYAEDDAGLQGRLAAYLV